MLREILCVLFKVQIENQTEVCCLTQLSSLKVCCYDRSRDEQSFLVVPLSSLSVLC